MTETDLAREDELLQGSASDDLLHRIVSEEMGERMAVLMRQMRAAHEAWHRRQHPQEGLRERKRRLTRQLISDAATVLFAIRGFDNVRVSEIADRVGVSEKTVYNYFPTKESLVLDQTDEGIERLARALRERSPGQSPTEAVVRALQADVAFDEAPDELVGYIPAFRAMIDSTPALHAAWLEVQDRLVAVACEELAKLAEVDPTAPEPMVAARALAGLSEVSFQSQIRHIEQGLRGPALRAAVNADLERAGRLLETGLWSFRLLARGGRAKQQAIEAARAAEEARTQVLKALRQARAAWAEVRGHDHAAGEVRRPRGRNRR
ncbi:MAG: TetR/AcrR family transcriptional regulator [Solirubrobacteraceae bacterium]